MELETSTDGLNLLSRSSRDQQGTTGGSERNPLRQTSPAFPLAQGRKANVVRALGSQRRGGEEVATELRCRGGQTSVEEAEASLKSSDIKAPFLGPSLPAAPSVPSQDGHVESSVAAVSIAQDVKHVTVWWRSLRRFTPPAALVSVLVGTGLGGNHGSVFGTP